MTSVRRKHYPESLAGGFSRVDGTIAFYGRLRALLEPGQLVIDLGAGRGGEHVDDSIPYRRKLRDLRGDGRHVIGLDVDEAVLVNAFIDEAKVISPEAPLPVHSNSVDVIVSDYVLEHVENPDFFVAEVFRVLKPGGWFCARTPNLFSYVGIAVNLIPNRLHTRLLRRVQAGRKEIDVFPTRYRMNSFIALHRLFPRDRWASATYSIDSEPVYVGESSIAWAAVRLLQAFTPRAFRTNLLVFERKL